jgi:hypothetical protein
MDRINETISECLNESASGTLFAVKNGIKMLCGAEWKPDYSKFINKSKLKLFTVDGTEYFRVKVSGYLLVSHLSSLLGADLDLDIEEWPEEVAVRALYNAATDKEAFAKYFGVENDEDENEVIENIANDFDCEFFIKP